MSNMEDRLRDAFRADAQTVATVRQFESPTAWQPARERPARERRVLVPLAAAAALALIIGGAVVAPKLWHRSDDNHPAATGLAGGFPGGRIPAATRPAFLVAVVPKAGNVFNTRLDVISTKTGRVTGSIASAGRGLFFAAIARYSAHAFIAEVGRSSRTCKTSFDLVTVSKAGHPGLTTVLGSTVPGSPTMGYDTRSGALAASPGLRVFAYALDACGNESAGEIAVVRPAVTNGGHTTTRSTWPFVYPAQPESLSLTSNGGLLSLVSNPSNRHAGTANAKHNSVWGLRTTGRGGTLHSIVKPSNRIMSGALSPTGAVTWVVTQTSTSPRTQAKIIAYQTATGKRITLIHKFAAGKFDVGPTLSLDLTGRYGLISDWQDIGQPRQHSIDGIDLVTGKIFTIPGNAGDQATSTAW
jgi:hypothetical protein